VAFEKQDPKHEDQLPFIKH